MKTPRLFRASLLLLPEELRHRHGDDMISLYGRLEADARSRGAMALLGFRLHVLWGVLRCAVTAWSEESAPSAAAHRSHSFSKFEEIHLMWLDIRTALRSFIRTPGFSVVTVLLVALGVGATTAIFSVVDGVMLRPLPYPDPDGIVYFDRSAHSLPLFREWQEGTGAFELLAAAETETIPLVEDSLPENVQAGIVTGDFFELFGAWALHGRLLAEDDYRERRDVVVLSHSLWQRRWGGDPTVVGTTIDLRGGPRLVVGITNPGLRSPEAVTGPDIDVWLPFHGDSELIQKRNVHTLEVAARLRTGTALETAQAELDRIAEVNAERYPETDRTWEGTAQIVPLVPLHEATVGDVGPTLLMLLGSVVLLLLIACANVASLFLARATSREREIAVRAALGAGRGRLARQLLTESLLFSVMGGLLGTGLAWLAVGALRLTLPDRLPRTADLGVDLRVLGFAAFASVLTGVLFGTVPALRMARRDVHDAVRHTSTTASSQTQRLRSLLVVAEIAMALVLLVGAGLLFHSFVRIRSVDPGFDTERLVRLTLRRGGFEDGSDTERLEFARDALERIEALPDVTRAAAGWTIPFDFIGGGRCCWRGPFRSAADPDADGVPTTVHPITPGYFQVLNAPLVAGRELGWDDTKAHEAAVVVNREMARRLFGEVDPTEVLDQVVAMGENRFTVVGIVGNYQHYDLRDESEPYAYVSYPAFGGGIPMLSFAIRTSAPLGRLAPALRETIWAIDPRQPIGDLAEVDSRIRSSVAEPRFLSLLLGLFAGTSLLIAAGGIYASLLYSVNQRRRELGVRLALGASRDDVVRLVLSQGARLAAAGIGIGLIGAWLASRALDSMLFGVGRFDPTTLATVSIVLVCAVLLACWVPARRAAAVDPASTLRSD